jgi:hypothetical protein
LYFEFYTSFHILSHSFLSKWIIFLDSKDK